MDTQTKRPETEADRDDLDRALGKLSDLSWRLDHGTSDMGKLYRAVDLLARYLAEQAGKDVD